MSPFTVRSRRDLGYVAGNSLSGSRMDIRLKDSAASISVLTDEFIQDIGARNLSEALLYGNNTTLDLGESGEFGSGQEGNSIIEFEQRFRVRGLPATMGRNYFKWSIPTGIYNLERVEESRGPNSILFGVGSAGGIINVATKQALSGKPLRQTILAVGSHNSRRATVDLNEPLSNRQGGVRFNAVWDRTHSFRHHAYSETRAAHLAARCRPTARTQIRLDLERGVVNANIPRTGALYDSSLPWIQAGRPAFSATAEPDEYSPFATRLGAHVLRYISKYKPAARSLGPAPDHRSRSQRGDHRSAICRSIDQYRRARPDPIQPLSHLFGTHRTAARKEDLR